MREQIEALGNESSVSFDHPLIEGLAVFVRKDYIVADFLGKEVKMYSDRFVVSDNDGRVHLEHANTYDVDEVVSYVERLFEVSTLELFRYVKNMARYGLVDGDRIRFPDGKEAEIILPDFPISVNNVLYVMVNKDGSLSKRAPRMLYESTEFVKVVEE